MENEPTNGEVAASDSRGDGRRDGWSKALSTIPALGSLLMRLIRDPRVPKRNKLIFGGMALYVVLPVDLIPDFVPGIGRVDDVILVALALDAMLNRVPEEILREHWDGDGDVLETIRTVLAVATDLVPESIKAKLYSEKG